MPVIGNFQLATGQAAYGGGTAAAAAEAINVGLGFEPAYVKVFSLVAAGVVVTEFVKGDAVNNMGQGARAGVAPIAANGITVGTVTVGTDRVKGFTIGTGCIADATPYMWIALG